MYPLISCYANEYLSLTWVLELYKELLEVYENIGHKVNLISILKSADLRSFIYIGADSYKP